jgi:hypothetical protein
MTDISPHRVGDDPNKPTLLECIRDGVRRFNELHGIKVESPRKSDQPARDDETSHHLVGLAARMLSLHSAFATRGVAGPRDEDGRSVPLALALKAMAMLREHQQ